jgi:Carboxypeptidase regulatory-like domain
MMYALSSLLVAVLLGQAAPAATTGRIAGTVVLEDAKTPIAGAQILLFPASRPTAPFGMPPQALTDQEGRFVFDDLPPGSYRMEVRKTGLAPLSDPGRAPTAQVNAGQTTQVYLPLQKGAVIAGKILDAAGEPLTDARIMAMRRTNVNASNAPRLLPAAGGSQQTNDLGEFRIAGLAAGDYVVVALPQGGPAFGGPAVTLTANGTATTNTY